MAQQACEVCQVLGQSSQMKKPTVNCSSYIVMFLRQWAVLSILIIMGLIHSSFHKKNPKLLVKGWPRLNLVNFLFGYFPMDTLLFTCCHTKFWEFNGFVGCDLWKFWDLLLEAKSKYTINAIHKCAVNNMYNGTWWSWVIYLLVSLRELSMCNTTPSSYLCISDLPFCREILYVINYTREPFISWRPADF